MATRALDPGQCCYRWFKHSRRTGYRRKVVLVSDVITRGVTRVAPTDTLLQGVITDERQRNALRVAGENVPGVKRVRDYLLDADSNACSTA
jgi:hypothetical protein